MSRQTVVGPYGVEVFDIRITDEAFHEWLGERERLREDDYPDRPPDVDTPTLRAWLPHPGEEDLPYFVRHPKPDFEAARHRIAEPTLTISWPGTPQVRLHVLGRISGEFEVRVLFDKDVVRGRDYPAEMSPDAVWGDIEAQVIDLSERTAVAPRMTTYTDYVAFDAEMELAAADIDRGFANPVTTEGIVQ